MALNSEPPSRDFKRCFQIVPVTNTATSTLWLHLEHILTAPADLVPRCIDNGQRPETSAARLRSRNCSLDSCHSPGKHQGPEQPWMKPYLSSFFQLKSLQMGLARWGCFTSCQFRSDPLTAEGTVSQLSAPESTENRCKYEPGKWTGEHFALADTALGTRCTQVQPNSPGNVANAIEVFKEPANIGLSCMSSWPGFCGAPSLGWEVAKTDLTPTQEVCDAVILCQMHCIHVLGGHAPGAK